ncbi:MAG: organomercurial lyase [Actinomycetota bacterium]
MPGNDDIDRRVRWAVYDALSRTGDAPTRAVLDAIVGNASAVAPSLRRLHDAHALVLDERDEVTMALPFATRPTDHVVMSTDGRRWWANCAWDALAIPLMLDVDAAITSRWLDDGAPAHFEVSNGQVAPSAGLVHFTRPGAIWWDDIVET